jgi:hypothetical protein
MAGPGGEVLSRHAQRSAQCPLVNYSKGDIACAFLSWITH